MRRGRLAGGAPWRWLAVGAVAAVGIGACATPASDQDVEEQLRSAGRSVRGLGGDFRVFAINADSQVAAWTLAAEAAESGDVPLGRQLARRMELALKTRKMLVVGGPYPGLSRAICLDALARDPGRNLAGLTLVYVGSAESAGDVRTAARARGIRFVQRELP